MGTQDGKFFPIKTFDRFYDWFRFVFWTAYNNLSTSVASLSTSVANIISGVTDLTMYFKLAGRSGGQVANGGTAASENLTLVSTANATKGKILFGASGYDEVNDRLGIGTASPSFDIHASKTNTGGDVAIRSVNAANSGTTARALVASVSDVTTTIVSSNASSYTGTRIGITATSYGELVTTSTAGLIVAPIGAGSILVLGSAAAERMRLDAQGNLCFGSTSVGTSASKVISITNTGAAPTSSPADIVQLWGKDTTAGDANLYARNEGGKVERLTGLNTRRTADQSLASSITLTNITDLTFNVEAGKSYCFRATLYLSTGAGGYRAGIGGTCTATSIIYEGISYSLAAITAQTRATALGTVVCAVTATASPLILINGTITVNAAGTLTAQFAQGTSNAANTTVLRGSSFHLLEVS